MVELDHLSYSSISAYQSCARAWRFRYVDRMPSLTSPALVFGSAFHGTIEGYLFQREQHSPERLPELWKEAWAGAIKQEVDWRSELPEQFENDGNRMLAHPEVQRVVSSIQPLTEGDRPVIERRVELRVPGVPVPIIGYIDVITEDGVPCDFKTAARSWGQDQAAGETQPLFYLAALNQAGFKQNPDYWFRHYIFVKTKTPQVQVIDSQHHPASLFWLFESIKEVWKGIQHDVYPPNPGSWKCNERFCDYWHLCRGKR